ncbi:LacI family DNA-binding transcriptional regulator [Labrys sp. ZIDIC5]|uniref:LacI family DNA-binding transcriptional regulator n=1 Tax=Labrys sedimenti TaxID=3106036 RepID=UPI002ACA8853|nr:LacI family DNA-binding transcriptional regulator [Labrys sp. ZIDIC5]MDZ5449388.1 LacI family DNA-binding transcriptional regulator [Labrys sp. ZIDIC5]
MSTISKVAERAGVSRTTVSHAINHADRVSKELRERVEQAIRELGYQPNPQARSLRTGRTDTIAMLIPDIRNPFYPELVKTAQSELEQVGLDMLIFNTDVPGGHSQDHGREYLRQIRNRRVDGLIVGDFALHGMHEVLEDIDVPTVFIGHLPNQAVDSIRLDDFGGGYLMGEYLARQGHRRIAHVTGPDFFSEAMARADGFEKALSDNGVAIDPTLRFTGSYLAPSGREAAAWLRREHGHALPTAVFFANYLMASGALTEFYDSGISVPGQLAVAVFDDLPQLEYVRPRLTRVGNSPATLARQATTMLLERLNGSFTGPARTATVPSILHPYDSA